jgi:SAM-dependent methyltransferase
MVLDVGCGSGLSGLVVGRYGLDWVGIDISGEMLEIARTQLLKADGGRQDVGQYEGHLPDPPPTTSDPDNLLHVESSRAPVHFCHGLYRVDIGAGVYMRTCMDVT